MDHRIRWIVLGLVRPRVAKGRQQHVDIPLEHLITLPNERAVYDDDYNSCWRSVLSGTQEKTIKLESGTNARHVKTSSIVFLSRRIVGR